MCNKHSSRAGSSGFYSHSNSTDTMHLAWCKNTNNTKVSFDLKTNKKKLIKIKKKSWDFHKFYNVIIGNNNKKLQTFAYNNPHDKQCLGNMLQNVFTKYKTSRKLDSTYYYIIM